MIAANIQKINQETGPKARLIAVSKTKPVEALAEAYEAGQRIFGENKVQEMCSKQSVLPMDIEWHLIGHLQSNKVKYIAPFVAMIHSVDSYKLLEVINKEAEKNQRVINCLLQVFIATEETKFGLNQPELIELLETFKKNPLPNIQLCGLMGMASNVEDTTQIRAEFKGLKNTFTQIKNTYFANDEKFKELSMGMSSDYKIAIEEGSTLIRVGSIIFGSR
ncbi:MAG: YggS family pyridoxal phosphate-dependent enzyme [Bacteroidetes bacterium B1(2017)]|nr:MAG: YggS family pyridoxal phosphate-dependent enzyme [Bacteroidetes bacterium B1(2017)]